MMRYLYALMAVLLSWAAPAFAQTGSVLTQPQLNNEINMLFPDNVLGLITPQRLRQLSLDAVATQFANPGNAIVLYATNFSGATAGDRISACVAALPFQGGFCDARGLPALGTIPSITIAKSGVTILGPCGVQNVTGTINIYNAGGGVTNTNWYGCGASFDFDIGTQFFWTGNNTDPMFRLRGVRDSYYANFAIKADLTNPLAQAIQLETSTGAVSTNRIFNNILVYSVRATGLLKGFRWCVGDNCGGAGSDVNNDLDTLYNVIVANYDNCAFSLGGTQVKTISFINSSFAGQSQSQRGVCSTQETPAAGSIRWFGGGGGRNVIADFDLGAVTDTIKIQDVNSEGSGRLLQTSAATSADWVVNVIGGRWTADMVNADGKAILYKSRGPLNVDGLNIETGSAMVTPTINIETSGAPAIGNAKGMDIQSYGAISSTNPFVCNEGSCWNLLGNFVTSEPSGNNFAIPNAFVGGVSCSGAPTSGFTVVNGIVTAC